MVVYSFSKNVMTPSSAAWAPGVSVLTRRPAPAAKIASQSAPGRQLGRTFENVRHGDGFRRPALSGSNTHQFFETIRVSTNYVRRPCFRNNALPSSVAIIIAPLARVTKPSSIASSQIVKRGHDVRKAAITSS